jgi:hypothetical protein
VLGLPRPVGCGLSKSRGVANEEGATRYSPARIKSASRDLPEKNVSNRCLSPERFAVSGSPAKTRHGVKRRSCLEENIESLNVRLTAEDRRRVDEIAPRGVAAGLRYPEAMIELLNR